MGIGVQIAVFTFGLIVIVYMAVRWSALSAKRQLRLSRNRMTLDRIYCGWYSERGLDPLLVKTAWCELAQSLDIDQCLLRPDDRLADLNLMCRHHFESFNNRLTDILNHYLPGVRHGPLIASFRTIDDLIVYICRNWDRKGWTSSSMSQMSGQTEKNTWVKGPLPTELANIL